ncbi:MAG: tetratricopeptide repeat protein [Gammaproteobacteria bacterium]
MPKEYSDPFFMLLNKINTLMQKRRNQQPLKAFISYAEEDISTPEGKDANDKLRVWLKRLRSDLLDAGIFVYVDISDKSRQMEVPLQGNLISQEKLAIQENLAAQENLAVLSRSDVIFTINTPRFKALAEQKPLTALGHEYQLTLATARTNRFKIFPLHYGGDYNEAFSEEFKAFAIHDCRQADRYEEILVGTQRRLGIIPAIYEIRLGDIEYQGLLQQWHWQKLTRLPPANPLFVGREALLEQLASSFQLGQNAICLRQTIGGLGGMGKTELALAFAHRQAEHYDMVRWLHAEGNQLQLEFTQLAAEIGIYIQVQEVKQIIKAIYRQLSSIRWLLILDNVDDYASVKSYLPEQVNAGQHLLITSRSQDWRNVVTVDTFFNVVKVNTFFNVVTLGTFSLEETGAYLGQILLDDLREDAQALAEAVEKFPLALSHSAAYIQQTNISIKKYLEIYQAKRLELLQTTGTEDRAERYLQSVLTTFAISMDKLKTDSPQAAQLLTACAYLAPNTIPLALFEDMVFLGQASQVQEAVTLLLDYLLVEPSKLANHIQIHPLVQAAIRQQKLYIESPELIMSQLKAIKKALNDRYLAEDKNELKLSDYQMPGLLLLPHVQMLVKHLESWIEMNKGEANIPATLTHAEFLGFLANLLVELDSDVRGAQAHLELALTILERQYGSNHPELVSTLSSLGYVRYNLGENQSAQAHFVRVLSIQEQQVGTEESEIISTLSNLCLVLDTAGDLLGAKTYYERLLKILWKDDPEKQLSFVLTRYAGTLYELGEFYGALGCYEEALKIEEKLFGQMHPKLIATLSNLGNAQSALGNLEGAKNHRDRAEAIVIQALAAKERRYGPKHLKLVPTLSNLGNVQSALGKHEDAKKNLERALEIQEQYYHNPKHPKLAATLSNLGSTLDVLGKTEDAKVYLDRALKIEGGKTRPTAPLKRPKGLSKLVPNTTLPNTLYSLSLTEEKTGDLPKALELAQRAEKAILEQRKGFKLSLLLTKCQAQVKALKEKIAVTFPTSSLAQNPVALFSSTSTTPAQAKEKNKESEEEKKDFCKTT